MPTAELLGALARLDALLRRALISAEAAHGPQALGDAFRGLHIGQADVERLLAREPGEPVLSAGADEATEHDSALAALGDDLSLSPFELDVLVIALAPELDLKYERVFAYLQDDVTRRRPSVDLALDLLCESGAERLACRSAFNADAPLIRDRLIELVADDKPEPPLLRRALKVDDQVVRRLLATGGLDARLAASCELVTAARGRAVPLPEPVVDGLDEIALDREPPRLYFQGRRGSGRRAAAEVLANARAAPLLVADIAGLAADLMPTLFREAALHGALLFLTGADDLLRGERAADLNALLGELRRHAGAVVVAGAEPWSNRPGAAGDDALRLRVVEFAMPDRRVRGRLWQEELDREEISLPETDLDALAGRFRLTAGQIREAAAEAATEARREPGQAAVRLFAAARAQTGQELGGLAAKIDPSFGWDDIVLPDDALAQLRELCGRVVERERVLVDWGFERKLSLGRGVSALFAGPPGTGKTMAAEIVANALGLDLYRIDLAGVVSKWIGETEKNLDRIFAAAEDANAILLFDEADALFGKRSEVKESHDRYANVEISYLLQKMEEYEGVAILATNRMANLDEAFLRRLSFVVRFPFPEVDERLRIWLSIWPEETPLADDVDLQRLAREHSFSGAEIKNVALAAAFLAVDSGMPVTMGHVLHAVRREYEKAGKSYAEAGTP